MSIPSSSTTPSVGSWKRAMTSQSVDFPAPLGPTSATTWPAGISERHVPQGGERRPGYWKLTCRSAEPPGDLLRAQGERARGALELGLLLEDVEHAIERGETALGSARRSREHSERLEQHGEVEEERHQVAGRERLRRVQCSRRDRGRVVEDSAAPYQTRPATTRGASSDQPTSTAVPIHQASISCRRFSGDRARLEPPPCAGGRIPGSRGCQRIPR